jgi:hypothetical protein
MGKEWLRRIGKGSGSGWPTGLRLREKKLRNYSVNPVGQLDKACRGSAAFPEKALNRRGLAGK